MVRITQNTVIEHITLELASLSTISRDKTNTDEGYVIDTTMGVARIFQRGGHTDSYIGYSPNCHLNIVGCLLTKRLTKGGSRAPQDPPLATPLDTTDRQGGFSEDTNPVNTSFFVFQSMS